MIGGDTTVCLPADLLKNPIRIPVFVVAMVVGVLLVAYSMAGASWKADWSSVITPTAFAYLPIVYCEPTPTPSIRIWGHVTLEDGTGVGDVGIYVGVVCNPIHGGSLVATTEPDGSYDTEIGCPEGHDETLRVYPVRDRYGFEPAWACWRTYGYCPDKYTDFAALPTPGSHE
jgi:hypothetical protein